MNERTLQDALLSWLRVSTWHTGHPKDDERFHQALNTAFDKLGPAISSDDFREAIKSVLAERYPGQEKSMSHDIEEYAGRAEIISSYLYDVR
ncbi:hypothetical protein D3C79_884430 [compost metagenome]